MQFYFFIFILYFFFLQNITQSIVPNIEKFAIQKKNGFRANCSDCEVQIYKV